jgi:hypothetical protein
VRPHPAIETTAYFCCVGLVEDMAGPERAIVDLGQDASCLRLAVAGTRAPTADTEQLVRDRADAFGGTVSTTVDPPVHMVTVVLPLDPGYLP